METSARYLLVEENTTTAFQFQDSFPDNVVLPINSKQFGITSFDKITSINQLTPNLQNFINTLRSAVATGKLNTGVIKINAEADGNTTATKEVPGGDGNNWSQAQIDFSYSNGATVSNQTLADRRAEGIEFIIKKFLKLPAGVTISRSGTGAGNKKMVTAIVPITTYNLQSGKVSIKDPKSGKTEILDLKATKYSVPTYDSQSIPIAKCNANLQANGQSGDPIAFRSKLDTKSGIIILNFDSLYIPDRLVITRYNRKTKKTTIVHDTGYISSDARQAQVDFGNLLAELNKIKPNGYNGKISQITGDFNVDLGQPLRDVDYFIEIYAPLGPTVWYLSIKCPTPTDDTQTTTLYWGQDYWNSIDKSKSINDKTYWENLDTSKMKLVPIGNAGKAPGMDRAIPMIAWTGTMKNSQKITGKLYLYDKDGVATAVHVYQDGKVINKQGQI